MLKLLVLTISMTLGGALSKSKVVTQMAPRHWVLKSEPAEYGIQHLEREQTGRWDGVRNYQARNYLKDMREDDIAFFYHSKCPAPGIYGRMKVSGKPYPDPTALDRSSDYYDKRATEDKNPWISVDFDFELKYEVPLLLSALKSMPLGACPLTAKGNRLSVIPLSSEQYDMINSELEKLNNET